jgi:hypothetical protein
MHFLFGCHMHPFGHRRLSNFKYFYHTCTCIGNRSKRPHFFPKYIIIKKCFFVIQMFINVFPRFVFFRILFLFYYIFINLFIKIINLINDDCIQLNLYVSLIITIHFVHLIICLYRCRWSLMSLITGKKVKTHTSQGIVKNKCTKPTKEF